MLLFALCCHCNFFVIYTVFHSETPSYYAVTHLEHVGLKIGQVNVEPELDFFSLNFNLNFYVFIFICLLFWWTLKLRHMCGGRRAALWKSVLSFYLHDFRLLGLCGKQLSSPLRHFIGSKTRFLIPHAVIPVLSH